MKTPIDPAKPWFREPWPWLLMSGPAVVVVAGLVTAVLAVRTQDGLVVDDYYKQGLAVNSDISRDLAAKVAGYRADATIDFASGRTVLTMSHAPSEAKNMRLTFSRAASSGNDRHILLQRSSQQLAENTFTGTLEAAAHLQPGKWYVLLDDDSHTWRLVTNMAVLGDAPVTFTFGESALKPADD